MVKTRSQNQIIRDKNVKITLPTNSKLLANVAKQLMIYPTQEEITFSTYDQFIKIINSDTSYKSRYAMINNFISTLKPNSVGIEGLNELMDLVDNLYDLIVSSKSYRFQKRLTANEKLFMQNKLISYANYLGTSDEYYSEIKYCYTLEDFTNMYFTILLKHGTYTNQNMYIEISWIDSVKHVMLKQINDTGKVDILNLLICDKFRELSQREQNMIMTTIDRLLLPIFLENQILGVHTIIIASFLNIDILPFSGFNKDGEKFKMIHARDVSNLGILLHDVVHSEKYIYDIVKAKKNVTKPVFNVTDIINSANNVYQIELYHFYKYFTINKNVMYYDLITLYIAITLHEFASINLSYLSIVKDSDYIKNFIDIMWYNYTIGYDSYIYITDVLKCKDYDICVERSKLKKETEGFKNGMFKLTKIYLENKWNFNYTIDQKKLRSVECPIIIIRALLKVLYASDYYSQLNDHLEKTSKLEMGR